MNSINELKDLIRLCKDGNSVAQEKLYKMFYGCMMNVCLRYSNNADDAVEVLNAGFLKVFQHLDRYQGDGELFHAWVRKIMVNTALDKIRYEKNRYANTVPLNINSDSRFIENDAVSNLNEVVLLNMIQELPPMSRAVFNFYVFENYNHKEIAEMLNMKESTSQWHLLNARRMLQEKLNKLYNQELASNE